MIQRYILLLWSGQGSPLPPDEYSPSLDFSDARNSMYSQIWN